MYHKYVLYQPCPVGKVLPGSGFLNVRSLDLKELRSVHYVSLV